MATLTQTSTIARKVIRFAIYGLIIIIVTRAVIVTGTRIYRRFFPKPPPTPTVSFGRLTTLPFPENLPKSENLTFNLETAEGDLPEFLTQAKVYFMPKDPPSIQDLKFAKQTAVSLGFSPNARELVETVFLFQNRNAPSTLTINIVSGIFSISYDLRANPRALENIPPAPDTAASQTRSILARANLLAKDLSGPFTHEFIKIEEGNFVSAISLSEADLIKVNIYRKEYDELPSATQDPGEATVWFMLSGSRDRGNQVIAAEYRYYPVDEEQSATYPIITAQVAWEKLTGGTAIVASSDNDSSDVTIRRVYLAYYDAGQYTEFYQPVVVFEGDNNFVAYVPAVTDEYYGE
ncbi:MAG: hypothetical protein ACC618_04220 [Patescibacteria group bacterium]